MKVEGLYMSSKGALMRRTLILSVVMLLCSVPLMATGSKEDLLVIDIHTGTSSNSKLGWNITNVGDLLGDGYDDYAIGAPGINKVYIWNDWIPAGFTTATGAQTSPDWIITGSSGSDFGWSISGLGDYDGDGNGDLIIGAPGENRAYIFKGRSASTALTHNDASISINGRAGEDFGQSVAGLEFEGPGYVFAAVGAPDNDHIVETSGNQNLSTGAIFVYNLTYLHSQGTTSLPWHHTMESNGFIIKGDGNNSRFGHVVANIGDINLDGRDDLGIGDPFQIESDATNNGAFFIQYGKSLQNQLPEFLAPTCDGVIYGRNNSYFGWSTARIFDVLGTSDDDLLIGAPLEGPGHAYIFMGSSVAFNVRMYRGDPADVEYVGINNHDRFGWSLCRADIISQFAQPQLFFGSPGYDNGTSSNSGAVFGFYGVTPATYLAQNSDTSYVGGSQGINLGYSVSEVKYESNQSRLASSAPYHGSNDVGRIYILERNKLPEIGTITVFPSSGNQDTVFDITVIYKDDDNDPASFVEVTIYNDSAGMNPILTLNLNKTEGDPESGEQYLVQTKLPNSIHPADRSARLYMDARAKAVRGSVSTVKSQSIRPGPIVDGIAPSAPENVYTSYGGLVESQREEGTFYVNWEWPDEDGGFPLPSNPGIGTVSSLLIKIQENDPITESNWDDAILYREIRSNIPDRPLARDSTVIGSLDPLTNPNGIRLERRNRTVQTPRLYHVAIRGVDDVGNMGQISESVSYEPWWKRPLVPNPLDEPTLSDHPGDDGGQLLVFWGGSTMLDTEYYWVFIDEEPFETIEISNGVYRTPDFNVTRDNDIFYDSYNFSKGLVIDTWSGGPIIDGRSYYAAVVPVNWLGQFDPLVVPSLPAKVINDNETAIATIKDLTWESTAGPAEISITLYWTPSKDPKFTSYKIYGQSYSFEDLDNAILIATITNRANSSYRVTRMAGDDLEQGKQYGFAILVEDYNDHINTKLTRDENYVYPCRAIISGVEPMEQVKGVNMRDKDNDGGGALVLTWYSLIIQGRFWSYKVYFSDEPILSVSAVDPFLVIGDHRTDEIEINMSGDLPLIDGKDYYAVVTIVDWNDVENTLIDRNNTGGPTQPVNQSDTTPPVGVSGIRLDPEWDPEKVEKNRLRLLWNSMPFEIVPDFNHYIITYWSPQDPSTPRDVKIFERDINSLIIDGLRRGTTYFFNVSMVDDNGNRGTGGMPINGTTAGENLPPHTITISLTIVDDEQEIIIVYLNDTEEYTIDISNILKNSDIFFGADAQDDYTSLNRMLWLWNLTTPDGTSIEKDTSNWKIGDLKPGTYTIKLSVGDDEGAWSDEIVVRLIITQEPERELPWWIWLIVILVVIIVSIVIIFVVMRSSKTSQEKEIMEQYNNRLKEIDSMEPIYVNLPSWTCSCGTTAVNITKSATCPACYESFEGVPIDGIDQYLKDHELVLNEMRIAVPLGWQGQENAIGQAEKDLEERKKRSKEALDEQFAPYLKVIEKKKEIKKEEKEEEEQKPPEQPTVSTPGVVVPGQMPPPTESAPSMGQPPKM
ncbi:MAG: hypothetical protein QCI82_10990 [Candidatus Thermoplasmatota archaeon]|nr:hypothetical protein [Candidatus Thermoplasmatota archaeon]